MTAQDAPPVPPPPAAKRRRVSTSSTAAAAASPNADDYLKMILKAPVYDVAKETPIKLAPQLSQKARCSVFLKREDDQPVFSFKIRGAYNMMVNLPQADLQKGVLACSAGNHAQGVAASALKLGAKATICMPTCTPAIKVDAVKAFGGEVVLKGKNFDEAKAECMRLHKETGQTIVPPFDNPLIIAGQGTVAVEIFRQLGAARRPDVIFTAVGGGGLIAGITLYTKRVFPGVKVIGVEACDAAAMKASLAQGKVVTLDDVGVFAEGAAVKTVGAETFRVAKGDVTGGKGVEEVVSVTNDEICAAIKDVFEDTRTVVEGAGALSVAGMLKYARAHRAELEGKNVVCVTSGANLNFSRLRFVAERAEIGQAREALLTVVIPEQKGSFHDMYKCIAPLAISEFSYRFRPGGKAFIFVAVHTTGTREEDIPPVLKRLNEKGMPASDETGMFGLAPTPPLPPQTEEIVSHTFLSTPSAKAHTLPIPPATHRQRACEVARASSRGRTPAC